MKFINPFHLNWKYIGVFAVIGAVFAAGPALGAAAAVYAGSAMGLSTGALVLSGVGGVLAGAAAIPLFRDGFGTWLDWRNKRRYDKWLKNNPPKTATAAPAPIPVAPAKEPTTAATFNQSAPAQPETKAPEPKTPEVKAEKPPQP